MGTRCGFPLLLVFVVFEASLGDESANAKTESYKSGSLGLRCDYAYAVSWFDAAFNGRVSPLMQVATTLMADGASGRQFYASDGLQRLVVQETRAYFDVAAERGARLPIWATDQGITPEMVRRHYTRLLVLPFNEVIRDNLKGTPAGDLLRRTYAAHANGGKAWIDVLQEQVGTATGKARRQIIENFLETMGAIASASSVVPTPERGRDVLCLLLLGDARFRR